MAGGHIKAKEAAEVVMTTSSAGGAPLRLTALAQGPVIVEAAHDHDWHHHQRQAHQQHNSAVWRLHHMLNGQVLLCKGCLLPGRNLQGLPVLVQA